MRLYWDDAVRGMLLQLVFLLSILGFSVIASPLTFGKQGASGKRRMSDRTARKIR